MVQGSLCGHEGWRPGFFVVNGYIEHTAPVVLRHVIVSEACNTTHLCIFIEIVSSGCIGNKTEEVFISQVVDPWKGSVWCLDYIFFSFIIEMAEFHICLL